MNAAAGMSCTYPNAMVNQGPRFERKERKPKKGKKKGKKKGY